MAPRKRKLNFEEASAQQTLVTGRVTRSSTRKATLASAASQAKKAKGAPKVKKPKETKNKVNIEEAGAEDASEMADGVSEKTIVIEHCKQCNSFKTRAMKVKDSLEKSVPGITVLVNPDKPRRGCFEVREEGGKVFISLLGMKRPFTPMKNLDMEDVISDIIKKIK